MGDLPAYRDLLLHLPEHELHARHLLRQAEACGLHTAVRPLRLLLSPTGGRSHRPGTPFPAPARPDAHGQLGPDPVRIDADPLRAHQEGLCCGQPVGIRRDGLPRGSDPGFAGRVPGHRRLRHPDLLRLLGIHRHRHRFGPGSGLSFPRQFQLPLFFPQHHRILETVAHQPLQLAPGLPLHSPGWEPEGPAAPVGEPAGDHAPGRTLARRRVALRSLGSVSGDSPHSSQSPDLAAAGIRVPDLGPPEDPGDLLSHLHRLADLHSLRPGQAGFLR